MAEPVYVLDFRRMTVEQITDPKAPGGFEASAPETPEGITFTVRGSVPVPEDQA
jgi:hypothetical protein